MSPAIDLIMVGGGLANGLLAHRLATTRPDLRLLVLESGATLGGNHTWSFHASDLDATESAWLDPFVAHRWPGYDVSFPGGSRRVGIGYRSVTSERFHAVLSASLGPAIRLGTDVETLDATRVTLRDGAVIEAGAVIDGRGPMPTRAIRFAWQKFVGLELAFEHPHGLAVPILMDATVEQIDGYRFVYVLPLDANTLLVEDTYYADGPALDVEALRRRIARYVARRGWGAHRVLREEVGVLPITLAGDIAAFWREAGGVPRVGLRAALFHPTTGYSLPDAVHLADRIAGLSDLSAPALAAAIRHASIRHWRRAGFFRGLNRMLFGAGPSVERYRMLERFYGLPEATIRRFYAGRLGTLDKVRLLSGRPPVPVIGAARALLRSGVGA